MPDDGARAPPLQDATLCTPCHGSPAADALDAASMETSQQSFASATGASPAAIAFHYDIGSAFYALWLGRELTYSCALFADDDDDDDDLESAQRRKIDHHAHEASAVGATHVLDVGCGWGSTMRRLVSEHGVARVTGLTLSLDQARCIAALDEPRIEARLESWREHEPSGPYDAIVSIGAFEHFVGRDLSRVQKVAAYREFFDRCHGWLRPGCALSLQTIAYGTLDPAQISAFITSEIFPESDLPALGEIVDAAHGRFEIVRLRNDRMDYARTCREWAQRLATQHAAASAMVGADRVRHYERFLKMSAAGFESGGLVLLRITLRRIDA
jgi:cyclopropane-fatty-acyl-phospholipid synthase